MHKPNCASSCNNHAGKKPHATSTKLRTLPRSIYPDSSSLACFELSCLQVRVSLQYKPRSVLCQQQLLRCIKTKINIDSARIEAGQKSCGFHGCQCSSPDFSRSLFEQTTISRSTPANAHARAKSTGRWLDMTLNGSVLSVHFHARPWI